MCASEGKEDMYILRLSKYQVSKTVVISNSFCKQRNLLLARSSPAPKPRVASTVTSGPLDHSRPWVRLL